MSGARGELGEVLAWLVGIFEREGLDHQVVGGLAARCHGAVRELVDIDVYVRDAEALDRVAVACGPALTRAPRHHQDALWDLTYLTARRSGWTVEVAAAADARVRDTRTGDWVPAGIDFEAGVSRTVDGVEVRVMPRARLRAYKAGLGREVDRRDLREMGSPGLGRRGAGGVTP